MAGPVRRDERGGGALSERPGRARREVPAALGLFVIVLLSLQVFLLTVGLDALLADDDGLAWVTGICSVVLAAGSAAFYRYLR